MAMSYTTSRRRSRRSRTASAAARARVFVLGHEEVATVRVLVDQAVAVGAGWAGLAVGRARRRTGPAWPRLRRRHPREVEEIIGIVPLRASPGGVGGRVALGEARAGGRADGRRRRRRRGRTSPAPTVSHRARTRKRWPETPRRGRRGCARRTGRPAKAAPAPRPRRARSGS